ncbi:MAG: 50S ribosomal protein L11 methyltransferase, partial [Proteobacteria bacterium]|nr:50S ribosomal protein L11 methyltransferase [Pseudomonadota bacterium]
MTAALSTRDYAPFQQPTSSIAPIAPIAAPSARGTQPQIQVAPVDKAAEDDALLGQYIPIHYHYQMLDQQARIGGFEAAINHVVKPGMKVLELGAGTGVLSFFAARAGAAMVYSVERLPHVAKAARGFIAANGCGDRVQIVNGDAATYLPPEPVDVVICEMLHSAMLREKQLTVIASFKQRYLARFGGPLPRFLPEAAVLAVQPLMTDYQFHGYEAPVPMFVDATNAYRATNLAAPALYAVFSYDDAYEARFDVDLAVVIAETGTLNSLRFITKNLLTLLPEQGRSIDWDMMDLVIPLGTPVTVAAGD